MATADLIIHKYVSDLVFCFGHKWLHVWKKGWSAKLLADANNG